MSGLPIHWALSCALVWGLWTAPVSAQAQTADTLRLSLGAVIDRALDVSPDLDQARAVLEFAEARHEVARASRFFTEFSVTTAHAVAPGITNPNATPEDALYLDPDVRNDWEALHPFNQVEVQLLQPIYTWGELGGSIDAARHGQAVEAAAVDARELEVALRAAELYYNVLLTDELYRLAERTRAVVERASGELQTLLESGQADDADVFQLQITEQEFNQRVAEVTQSRLTARAALERQLLLPETSTVEPGADALNPLAYEIRPLDSYLDLALVERPELAQARAGVAARDALVRVARSDYYPKLFLGLTSTSRFSSGRPRQHNPFIANPFLGNGVEAGLGMRLQLNVLQTRARVEQAEAEREEVRAQLTGAQQLILFEVEKAYRDLLTAQAALEARDEALRISKEWLRVEYINFDLDLGDTENLVKAVRENLELEARYFESVHRYNLAVLRLLDAVGVLAEGRTTGTFLE